MSNVWERFKVTWVNSIVPQPLNQGDGDTIYNDVFLNSGDNYLLLVVTEQQYTELLSSAYNGAERAYPQNYLDVIYPLIKAGKVIFCDAVADCVDNSSVVQVAINNTIVNKGDVNPNSIDPDNTTGTERIPNADTESISSPPPSCDKDALWAGIRSMVDRLDQNGRDILEDLATINDKIEQIGELIDLVPLLGDTIKDVSDLFTEQIPDLLNAYNAASSPTFLDNVACNLFEMVCAECRYPTYDEVFGYLVDNSALSLPSTLLAVTYGVVWDVVKAVSVLTPEVVWYSINVWQCITLAFDGYFNRSYGKKTFQIWCSFGEDNPNDNWILLCDGCDETWCYQFDLTTFTNFDWSGAPGNQYLGELSGSVWITTTVTGIGTGKVTGIGVRPSVFAATDIDRIVIDYDATQGLGLGLKYAARVILKNGATTIWDSISEESPAPWGSGQQVDWSFDKNATEIRFYQAVDDTTGTPTGNGQLTGIKVYGTGVCPFGIPNC